MADQKKKISELPLEQNTAGLRTIGINSQNESVQVPLGEILESYEPDIKQVTGTSTTAVMSQKATTDAIAAATPENYAEVKTKALGSVQTADLAQATGTGTSVAMSQKAVSDELDKSVAKPWASGVTRPLNTLVTHNGVLYQVIKAAGTATEPASDNADYRALTAPIAQETGDSETSVMSQKAVSDSLFVEKSNFFNDIEVTDFDYGSAYNVKVVGNVATKVSGSTTASYKSYLYKICANESVYINARGGETYAPFAFLDNEMKVVQKVATSYDNTFEAPADGFVVVNDNSGSGVFRIISKTQAINDKLTDVETQLSDSISAIDGQISIGDRNWLSISARYINKTTGKAVSSSATRACTDFITLDAFPECIHLITWFNKSAEGSVLAFYDKDKAFISSYNDGVSGTQKFDITIYKSDYPEGAAYIRCSGLTTYDFSINYHINSKVFEISAIVDGLTTELTKNPRKILSRLQGEILNVAYSSYGVANINTAEGYAFASHFGFNAAKADIRITSDNVLVCCHDAGISLNDDGTIGVYDASTATPIRQMTSEEFLALKWPRGTYPYQQGTASFESFVYNCRRTNTIAYCTLRGEYLDDILPELFRILRKYNCADNAIINGQGVDTLSAVRNFDSEVVLSKWIGHTSILTQDTIDSVITLQPCIMTMFTEPGTEDYTSDYVIGQSAEAMDYARANGVPLMNCQVNSRNRYDILVSYGFTGFHITAPILDYGMKKYMFLLTVSGTEVSFADKNIASRQRYTADIELVGSTLVIKGVKSYGSANDFPDIINPILFRNPCASASATQNGNALATQVSSSTGITIENVTDGVIDVVVEC